MWPQSNKGGKFSGSSGMNAELGLLLLLAVFRTGRDGTGGTGAEEALGGMTPSQTAFPLSSEAFGLDT
jgi:hypothetical protein